MASVTIYSSGRGSQEVRWPEAVEVDGHDLSDVVSAVIEAKAGDVVTAVIRLQVSEFSFVDLDRSSRPTELCDECEVAEVNEHAVGHCEQAKEEVKRE